MFWIHSSYVVALLAPYYHSTLRGRISASQAGHQPLDHLSDALDVQYYIPGTRGVHIGGICYCPHPNISTFHSILIG